MEFFAGGVGDGIFLKHHGLAGEEMRVRLKIARLVLHPFEKKWGLT
jgi:hypothetical protein